MGVLTRQNSRLSRSQTPSVCTAALPLQNIPLSFEKGIKDITGSFNKWFLLLLQEHGEALGYAVLQAPLHSTTERSTAHEQAWPQLHQCWWHRPAHNLEHPAQPAGTGFSLVGISKSTSEKAWAEISCLATSGSELRAVVVMTTAAAVRSGLL